MQIQRHISLKPYNTFGIEVQADHFATFEDRDTLKEGLEWARNHKQPVLILGGGSNILFTRGWPGLVLHNKVKGIRIVKEDNEAVYIKVGAGEIWHQFVRFCLQHNYGGVENLALIPGLAGTAPLQNIGAYGVEIKEVLHELSALHRQELVTRTFSNQDCAFGYRESIFKNEYRDQYVITDVTYRLQKQPVFHIEYGAIKQELEKQKVETLSIQAIAEAVIAIRSSKLPDPAQIGNAGSFFKNPSVPVAQFESLKGQFPEMVGYPNADGTIKLAAGWLIDHCGLKGFRRGDAGIHSRQALVLVNYGNAAGHQMLELCRMVQDTVLHKFGISLLPEVNII